MRYKEALAKIEDSEVRQAIEGHVSELLDNSTTARRDRADLQSQITTLTSERDAAVQERDSFKTQTERLTTEKQQLEEKAKGFERRDRIRTEAGKIGANATVLERLLPADLEIKEGKVGDKVLKDYLSAEYADFMPALFPPATNNQNDEGAGSGGAGGSANNQEPPKPNLPTDKGSGNAPAKVDSGLKLSVPDFAKLGS